MPYIGRIAELKKEIRRCQKNISAYRCVMQRRKRIFNLTKLAFWERAERGFREEHEIEARMVLTK